MDSSRVQLEVAILAAEVAAAGAPPPAGDGQRLTVLVVAIDPDIRQYVLECLRERDDLRVNPAATVAEALTRAALDTPRLMVVDAPQCEMVVALPQLPAVMIVDEEPRRDQRPSAHVRFLGRPFSARALVEQVDQLLA